MPRIPSNLAATKVIPGSEVASANGCDSAHTPATYNAQENEYLLLMLIGLTQTLSFEMNPFIDPVPYWIAILRPSGLYVEDDSAS